MGARREEWIGRSWVSATALLAMGAIFAAIASSATAAAPVPLLQIPRDTITAGSAAGQLDNPREVAADPTNGHLFVTESANARISEFTAWGGFVKAWGWDVAPEGEPGDTAADQLEICTVTCKQGVAGSGAGQLSAPRGVTVDSGGNVYVVEGGNSRVQKFSAAGEFILMFGGEVNETTGGNLCTKASGDQCKTGVLGPADCQFADQAIGNYIAFSSVTNSIFVGDKSRIQEINPDGTCKSKIVFEGPELEKFKEKTVSALDIDSAGNLYIALSGEENVYKLSPTGKLLSPLGGFPVPSPVAVAVDTVGNVYVIEGPGLFGRYVLGFSQAGVLIEGMEHSDEFARPDPTLGDPTDLLGVETNLCAGSDLPGNLYVTRLNQVGAQRRSYVSTYGSPPFGCEARPIVPPEIHDQYAVSVDTDAAMLKAEINPRFWDDTTYYVQYGTAECPASGWSSGCKEQPLPPGADLTDEFKDAPVTTAGVFLAGLEPGTTYHYRFVAQSGGGGPVFGVGGEPGKDGAEGTFRTFALPTASSSCPANESMRVGASARLPDCRAYEMVSPLDKNNGDIVVTIAPTGFPISLFQASVSGDGIAYSAVRSFGDPEGAPLTSQYLAARDPQRDWANEAISPPRTRQVGDFLDSEFKAFSPDLCEAWLRHDTDPPLTADAVPGYFNLYRIDYCEGGGYETLTPVKPDMRCPKKDPKEPLPETQCPGRYFPLELQGVSADGDKAIYKAPDNLTADAPVNLNDRPQLYAWAEGQPLRFVCYRPDGTASLGACAVGGATGSENGHGREPSLQNALSDDGSRVYWTEGLASGAEPGQMQPERLYVRENPNREQSAVVGGKCTEPDKACTLAVSETVSSGRARYWTASADGSKAIFAIVSGALTGNLYEFDLEKAKAGEPPTSLIAKDTRGVLGASEDASRVYFVSTAVLDGAAKAGEMNLYLHAGGTPTFIATLAGIDIERKPFAAVSAQPDQRANRVTADGRHAAFTSAASLTGYDNRDVVSGEPDSEVYLYDADTEELVCVSCNPTGARPSGREGVGETLSVAAQLPTWERSLYASRLLSEDGKRLFFESYEALVPRDTNGVLDVYQWEATGKGDCDSADPTFASDTGGCIDLISSGESPRDSHFIDASADGDDVFFTTLSSLVPQDYGLVDLYDARVGGGFPPPPPPKPPCEGEACQSPPAAPNDPTPASSVFRGPGNVKPAVKRRRCGKGKRRVVRAGKTRCVKKSKRAQRKGRRAAR